ncbi:MAG: hydrogenase iron-sulfur subunit [Deltaproteobacteria bacterium]|nr:hydrogenase iron-sulfur subunit [Deltaproteobacteria bacterium]
MDQKIGVYICSGCGIGESIDLDALSAVADEEFQPAKRVVHPAFCGEEGAGLIRSDVDAGDINTVVVAACSGRVKTDVFVFDPMTTILERVNIREHVAWCQPAGEDDTRMLAEDYLRMGIIRAQKTKLPAPYQEEIDKTILVVGGGAAGLQAANDAAAAGYSVLLVEKEPEMGGHMAKWNKSSPTKPPYQELEEITINELIDQAKADERITIFTSATIEKIAGAPGMFDVTLNNGGGTHRVGAIVLAAGWKPYDATKLERFSYGTLPDVITSVQMEEMAKAGKITCPSDGSEPSVVAFIQCAGSRDADHLPYCSAVCCRASLKQSVYVKEQNPENKVFIFYKDIRTPEQSEEFYKKVQKDGTVFIKTDTAQIAIGQGSERKLSIEAVDQLMGEPVLVEADLVVLAVGMQPAVLDDPILNLQYRQGPALPELKYGFPDSHFICFPYETRRTGIYTAGCVRQPMMSSRAGSDGTGAALKAIQAVELTAKGKAVHPRAGDVSYPELFLQRCTQCKRCTEECPFGMYNEDEKGTPLPHPTRCRRCAICMGSCPERIISFSNYSVDMIGSMIKGINVPDEYEEKPRIVGLICENDSYPGLDMVGLRKLQYAPWVRFIPLRCLGSVNLVWIADALSKGIDGILLFGCRYGDDYQCHFVHGSELANTRMTKIQETLDRLMLESDRIRLEQMAIDDYEKIPKIIEEFTARLQELGPNPYKGF